MSWAGIYGGDLNNAFLNENIKDLGFTYAGKYGFKVDQIIIKAEHTRVNFAQETESFQERAQLTPNDLVIIHYSGHGDISHSGEFVFYAGK